MTVELNVAVTCISLFPAEPTVVCSMSENVKLLKLPVLNPPRVYAATCAMDRAVSALGLPLFMVGFSMICSSIVTSNPKFSLSPSIPW